MKYTVYDLGQCRRGERIQVSLQGNAANVRLMDSSNYSNYRSGRRNFCFPENTATRGGISYGKTNERLWH